MLAEAISLVNLPALPVTALLLFLVAFLSVLIWSGRAHNRQHYRLMENIPLREEEEKR